MSRCPICHGHAGLLGRLGRLFWLRCRQCGFDWSVADIEEED